MREVRGICDTIWSYLTPLQTKHMSIIFRVWIFNDSYLFRCNKLASFARTVVKDRYRYHLPSFTRGRLGASLTEHLNFKKEKHGLFLVRKVIFYIVLNFKMCILILPQRIKWTKFTQLQCHCPLQGNKIFRLAQTWLHYCICFLSLLFE